MVEGDEAPPGPQRTLAIIALWRSAAARQHHRAGEDFPTGDETEAPC